MWKVITLSLLLVLITACKDDDGDIIPDVSFIAEIYLNDPLYSGKTTFIVLPDGINRKVGVNGVVVYRYSMDQYYAFDLMCTHEHEASGYYFVELIEGDDFTLRCPECESEYIVNNEYGSVIKGPAVVPLKKYNTSVRGGYLTISNY